MLCRLPRFASIAVALLVLGFAASARAQGLESELHGYVEPCTIGNLQTPSTECQLCSVPRADPEACTEPMRDLGLKKKCRTRGNAKGWDEVWCGRTGGMSSGAKWERILIAVGAAVVVGALVFAQRRRSKRRGKKD